MKPRYIDNFTQAFVLKPTLKNIRKRKPEYTWHFHGYICNRCHHIVKTEPATQTHPQNCKAYVRKRIPQDENPEIIKDIYGRDWNPYGYKRNDINDTFNDNIQEYQTNGMPTAVAEPKNILAEKIQK